jgi:hypothetical protein
VAASGAGFAPAIIAGRLDDAVLALAERDHVEAAQTWAQVCTTLKDMAPRWRPAGGGGIGFGVVVS